MKFSTRLVVMFYVVIVMFVSCLVLLMIFDQIPLPQVMEVLYGIYRDQDLKIVVGIWTGILLLINFLFYRFLLGTSYKQKIIAFDNPSGRVSVSLSALEDLIKKMINRWPEIKESRVEILAFKKGLKIAVRLSLRSEANIPDLTAKIQESVKKKIQDVIGMEGVIDVTISISKFLPDEMREKREKQMREEKPANLPFQGYRA